ncbi:MAG TPA: lysylphosphatidylglycerol synthase transmembrane domain-containing protein, partial [Solirubrobacteraceae bacterium]|nr:lysylphosphatidylglycerol synthase transmembrane domain-containing protein [Solirubrobacteraceae bacterium]
AATRVGALPADGQARVRACRLPSLEPAPAAGHSAAHALIRKVGLVIAAVVGVALTVLALNRIGIHNIVLSLLQSTPGWVVAALAVMCGAMVMRALSWHAILRAALPRARIRRRDAAQGTFIGVLMSATLPARLGEPSRAFVVARRIGRIRESFPIVLGTLVSQTLLNIVALGALGAVMLSSIGVFSGRSQALLLWGVAPLALVIVVIVAPALLRGGSAVRSARLRRLVTQARSALVQVRLGLRVFRQPRLGAQATLAQFAAWAMQWMSCYLLLIALGLDSRVGIGGAAAVLFAVNVTAVLPVTPSNLGVFQAACVAVLSGAYGISEADGLGYGIILQAVEIATAVVMGMPALLKEGLSWRDVRLRAMHSTPVRLPARRRGEAPARSRA